MLNNFPTAQQVDETGKRRNGTTGMQGIKEATEQPREENGAISWIEILNRGDWNILVGEGH